MKLFLLPSKKYFTIIFCSVILAGCGLLDSDAEEALDELIAPETELIPLAVGNYWIYDQWQHEPTWRDTVRKEVLNMRDVIVENTKVRAYGTYRFRYDGQIREDALISLEASGPEGHYSLGFDAPLDSLNKLAQGLRYKYPANVGDAWEYAVLIYNAVDQELRLGKISTIVLLDTTKTVETSIGIFDNCYVYRFNDFGTTSTLVHHVYIKPGVGLVGIDTYAEHDLFGQQRLIEFDLDGTP